MPETPGVFHGLDQGPMPGAVATNGKRLFLGIEVLDKSAPNEKDRRIGCVAVWQFGTLLMKGTISFNARSSGGAV